MNISIHNLY